MILYLRITHFFFYASSGYHAICRELLAHGASVNLENLQGLSALGWAAEQGHVEVTRSISTPFVDGVTLCHPGGACTFRIRS